MNAGSSRMGAVVSRRARLAAAAVASVVLGSSVAVTLPAEALSRSVVVSSTQCPTNRPPATGSLGQEITGTAGRTITRSGYAPGTPVLLCVFPQAQAVWAGAADSDGLVVVPTGSAVAPTFTLPTPAEWYYVLIGVAADGSPVALTQQDFNVNDDPLPLPEPGTKAAAPTKARPSATPRRSSSAQSSSSTTGATAGAGVSSQPTITASAAQTTAAAGSNSGRAMASRQDVSGLSSAGFEDVAPYFAGGLLLLGLGLAFRASARRRAARTL